MGLEFFVTRIKETSEKLALQLFLNEKKLRSGLGNNFDKDFWLKKNDTLNPRK